ncbi:MAG: flagellar motor switch protein FliN [Gammaproteobacteria bacterium]|jgi:flagellar motor switch protein FliN/FliY|nr:flagellar motor switch protein FliN [Gammaproteobacteria bacterium]
MTEEQAPEVVEAAVDEAQPVAAADEGSVDTPPADGANAIRPVEFADAEQVGAAPGSSIDLLLDVPLELTVELGRTRMPVRSILALGSGSVIELEKLAGEPVDVLVNNRLIATGEVVVVDDAFGITNSRYIGFEKANRVTGLR